jgi:negative regulator of flagellin synthesis FlgM
MKIQEQKQLTAAELGVTGARTQRAEAQPAKQPEQEAAQAAGPTTGPAATVSLSSRSRELHGALAQVKAAPDVRDDKVAAVRRQLENGTYVIDPTRIARSILSGQG